MKNNYSRLKWVALIILGGILFFLSQSVIAATAKTSMFQEQEISGIVSDQNGIPIPGVTITVKNTNRGVVTNLDGEYAITAASNSTLVFSFIGFKKQEVTVDGREEINIQLEEDISALGEVKINAGYYNTTERERTGNISKVSGEEIELQPVTNPIEAIQGRMAGVEIIQENGIPGSAPTIRIRGQNSLRTGFDDNGNRPLYIIDGMPINSNPMYSQFTGSPGTDPLNTLNLANIESIEVLKDADATAIYGSRGANGVVLITTKSKKGYNKKTEVQASMYSGISKVPHFVDLLNTEQYLNLRQRAFENDGVTPTVNNAFDLLIWDQDNYTNWQRELLGGTAHLNNMNLNVSGGSARTSYLVGASYQTQGTVFPGDFSYEKKTFNVNLYHQSENERFRINFSSNYGIDKNDLFSTNTFVSNAISLAPNAPDIYQDDGSLNWEQSTWTNPLAILKGEGTGNTNNLIGNMSLEYSLTEALGLKVNLGYTRLDSKEKTKMPLEIYDPALWDRVSNRSLHTFINRDSWIAEPQLTYNKQWGRHQVSSILGATFQSNSNTNLNIAGTGYSDAQLIGNLEAADNITVSENRNIKYNYNAVFARLGYNFDKTYFLNLTGRRDGSSRFGPNNRFSNFGAIGAAWIFTEERSIKKTLSFLSFGKLRGSYGITGNDQIGDCRYLETYEATPGPEGLYPTQLTNPNFSWEKNKKLEAAIELGFLNDRLNVNLSWYRNRSSNQLVGYPLPAITGFSIVEANLPATVENKGWEFEFSALPVNNNVFRWRSSFNLSIPRNKLVSFPGIEQSAYQNTYRVGQPLDIRILYNFAGVDPETGLYSLEDVNNDGTLNFDDRVVTLPTGRKFFGGFQNQLSFKGFQLNFLFEFVKQKGPKFTLLPPGRIGNTLLSQAPLDLDDSSNQSLQQASQSIYALIAYNNYANNSDFRITDASFIRLKTLNLSYALPKKFTKEVGLADLNLFLNTQNLFTITDYEGLDPQVPGSKMLPALQSFTGGFQLTF